MSADIVTAIRNGSFPDSEELLSSHIDSTNTKPLLDAIILAKQDLQRSVSQISRDESEDVKSWIDQAKRAQQDIQRCKEDYRLIVQEHTRIEELRAARNDARLKTSLLEDEITFNETLTRQIELISETSAALTKIDADIRQSQLLHAAQSLPALHNTIQLIPGDQSRSLLSQIQYDLSQDLRKQLDVTLDDCITITTTQDAVEFVVRERGKDASKSHSPSLSEILDSFDLIGALDYIQARITKKVESSTMPHFHQHSKLHLAGASRNGSVLRLALLKDLPSAANVLAALKSLLDFVNQTLPQKLSRPVLTSITARTVPRLIVDWLDPAIPAALDQLSHVQELQEVVKDLASWLENVQALEASDLEAWINQIPRTWLSKRRATSLDAIRHAFKMATGSTHQVERIEKQTVVLDPPVATHDAIDDDWADNWDDDDQKPTNNDGQSQNAEDDGSDAWGFDTDDQDSESHPAPNPTKKSETEDDEGEAWGWGDEDEEDGTKISKKSPMKPLSTKANGLQNTTPRKEDVTLTEEYTVTDLPDYVLEQIGKDISDFQTLSDSPQTYFTNSTSPPSGMQTLPTLILAMFRATAPDHYTTVSNFSRMNLYNDTLYLVQKLAESAPAFISDIETMSKFARQTYTSELTLQRTILNDLLDNAQGFTSCTVEPYLSQCESSVSSTTEYLRSLHDQWSKILSPSHLSQSIGSLLSGVMSKMIKDIEDMEDIQESESKKLLQFMEQVSKLEDLFHTATPAVGTTETPVSSIALHAASYLRFQYLQQILDGSLADIKYLWTDAGLSLEFSADEVVDLIEALFAESGHRRSAIHVIRSGT